MNTETSGSFGLSESALTKIRAVFSDCPDVERVILYGSRAKGNYRNGSDIDLTIIGDHVTSEQFTRLQLALDDLLLPYTIDLSLMHEIDSPALLAHIRRIGVVFYERGTKI